MMRSLPPAGTPISSGELLRWPFKAFTDENALAEFEYSVRSRFECDYAWGVSSGRAAMTLVLQALSNLDRGARDEVVVPAYTCYSVAASIIKAGLKLRIADIDPTTLSYSDKSLQSLDTDRVLAVVSANLYGIPNNLPELSQFCEQRSLYLIDDAAQAMGARIGDRYAGTYGDVGIYSLDKGKNITTIQGGVIVSRNQKVAQEIECILEKIPSAHRVDSLVLMLKLIAYALLLHPHIYWLPERVLTLGVTPFEMEYPISKLNPSLSAIANLQFKRLDMLTQKRRENALELRSLLKKIPNILLPDQPNGWSVYARFPLIMPSENSRDDAVSRLRQCGLGGSYSYPRSIADIPQIHSSLADIPDAEGGREVARRIMTLPTHPFVKEQDRLHAADLIEELSRQN